MVNAIRLFCSNIVFLTLCFNVATARVTVDEVRKAYRSYREQVYPKVLEQSKNTPFERIGSAVAFANTYKPDGVSTKELAEIKYRILNEGWGVGGVSTRKATPEERASMMTILKREVAPYVTERVQSSTVHQKVIDRAIGAFRSKPQERTSKIIRSVVDGLDRVVRPVGFPDNPYLTEPPETSLSSLPQLGNCILLISGLYDRLISHDAIDLNVLLREAHRYQKRLDKTSFTIRQSFETLVKVSNSYWATYNDAVQKLTKSMTDKKQLCNSFEALARVDPNKWEEFIEKAQKLTKNMTNNIARSQIFVALARVDPNTWEEFIEKAQKLTKNMTNNIARSQIFVALARVDPNKWEEFIEKAQKLTKNVTDDIARSQIFVALALVDPNKWEEFIEKAQKLTKSMTGKKQLCNSFGALARVDPNKWEEFIEKAQKLTKNMTNNIARSQIFVALALVDPNKWEEFIEKALDLTKNVTDDTACSKIFVALSWVDPNKWEEFIEKAQKLTKNMTNNIARSKIFFALARVDPNKWEEFIEKALDLTKNVTDDIVYSLGVELSGLSRSGKN